MTLTSVCLANCPPRAPNALAYATFTGRPGGLFQWLFCPPFTHLLPAFYPLVFPLVYPPAHNRLPAFAPRHKQRTVMSQPCRRYVAVMSRLCRHYVAPLPHSRHKPVTRFAPQSSAPSGQTRIHPYFTIRFGGANQPFIRQKLPFTGCKPPLTPKACVSKGKQHRIRLLVCPARQKFPDILAGPVHQGQAAFFPTFV